MALKDKYYTISEAARELNVTRQTISRWVASGKVYGERIGRETLIEKKKLFEYKKDKLVGAAAKQIADLICGIYTDYCQEKGYIKAVERVTDVEPGKDSVELTVQRLDGTSWALNISGQENREILRLVEPKLIKYLEDFSTDMMEKARQLVGNNLPEEIRGGKKTK
jgi:excisionase family DNA binding protein